MKFMTEHCLVDTNILVYAFASRGTKHEKAKALVSDLMHSGGMAVSSQNLAEFCRVSTEKLAEKIPHSSALNAIETLSSSSKVVFYGTGEVKEALRLCSSYGGHFFDSLLAATMASENISTIYTENEKDFRKVAGLKVVNPFK